MTFASKKTNLVLQKRDKKKERFGFFGYVCTAKTY